MAHPSTAHVTHEAPAQEHRADAAEGGWLLALVLLVVTTAVTTWALVAPRAEPPAPPSVAETAPQPGPGADALGPLVERVLAADVRIRVPERGVEGRLLDFILAPAPVDRDTWFDFDRLTFDTGSATLRASSEDQLAAVAAILAAYPGVKLRIGGYTDDVGDAAANQRLSEQRAVNVRAALVQQGVSPERLTAEGYGSQHPVADNATPEGRARNRRISMRVTEKPPR